MLGVAGWVFWAALREQRLKPRSSEGAWGQQRYPAPVDNTRPNNREFGQSPSGIDPGVQETLRTINEINRINQLNRDLRQKTPSVQGAPKTPASPARANETQSRAEGPEETSPKN
ncbi:MAG: hypothetical protein IPP35_00605 [Elusimicrobia bacterium]|nr:hypothetical protein [Elusimicrobiota bacterium]